MVAIKLVNTLAPAYVGKVNPVLTLTEAEQSLTLYTKSLVNDKEVELSGLDRVTKLQKLGRQARGLSFNEFSLSDNFSVEDAICFAQGFYDPNFYTRDEKTFTVAANIADKFNLVNDHMNFLRDIINASPEKLYPEALAEQALERVRASASLVGLEDCVIPKLIKFDNLLEEKLTGIYAVGKGSAKKPCYLEIDFNPTEDPEAPVSVALVGKGITFDTGGYSIKPSNGMLTMRSDMGGAALMTATLSLAIAQGLDKRVKLFLSCAENMISSSAMLLGDIVEYANGVTATVDNTDAEGRLVLADSLIRASQCNNGTRPELIIDAATLTGAAKVAVGTDYHSLLSCDDALVDSLLAVAKTTNERFWRLPFEEFHREQISSPTATISNTGGVMQSAGSSTAAAFLSYFVEDYKQGWLHIDASATFNRRGGAEVAIGATGRGLQTLAKFLREYKNNLIDSVS